jgi:eukaryotic-like serine/threonine-protein kinase
MIAATPKSSSRTARSLVVDQDPSPMAADRKNRALPDIVETKPRIALVCTCGRKILARAEHAGKKIRCGKCRRILLVDPHATNTPPPPQADSVAEDPSRVAALAKLGESPREVQDMLAPAQNADEIGRLGPYRVLKVLGVGGMGVVFKAEDPGLVRVVALKAMLPSVAAKASARERFLREARAAASLKHDHVVGIFQVGEDRGIPYLAMEFLDGESLEDCLNREGRLAVGEVLRIGREIADGLTAAHEYGLIHRDIKPANVWMEKRPARKHGNSGVPAKSSARVRILDFGLARGIDDPSITQSGALVGTPAYMSMEQACNQRVDGRCDLYSLGVVLYRMVSGKMPFEGFGIGGVLAAMMTQTPLEPSKHNPSMPASLNDLIVRLLSKNADDRPASAWEVYSALNEIEAAPEDFAPTPPVEKVESAVGVDASAKTPLPPKLDPPLIKAEVKVIPVPKPEPKPQPTPVAPAAKAVVEITNSIGMKLACIRPDKFLRGTPDDFRREIEITREFHLGRCAVTQEEYAKVMGKNPSWFSSTGPGKDAVAGLDTRRFPVEMVNWNDAKEFCRRLSLKEGKFKEGMEYGLPTEAEWEFACRAGTKTAFHVGETLSQWDANFGDEKRRSVEVGSYAANAWGLYDMHGNVWQWCEDWHGEDYYRESPVRDPKGPSYGSSRVIRGGSWSYPAERCSSAYRGRLAPLSLSRNLGFRVILRSVR